MKLALSAAPASFSDIELAGHYASERSLAWFPLNLKRVVYNRVRRFCPVVIKAESSTSMVKLFRCLSMGPLLPLRLTQGELVLTALLSAPASQAGWLLLISSRGES